MYGLIASLLILVIRAFVVSITNAEDVDGQTSIWVGIALLHCTLDICVSSSDVEIFIPEIFSQGCIDDCAKRT